MVNDCVITTAKTPPGKNTIGPLSFIKPDKSVAVFINYNSNILKYLHAMKQTITVGEKESVI